jgi:hypothetical protein
LGSRIQSFTLFLSVEPQSFHLLVIATYIGVHLRKPHRSDLTITENWASDQPTWPTLYPLCPLIQLSMDPKHDSKLGWPILPSGYPGPTTFCGTTTNFYKNEPFPAHITVVWERILVQMPLHFLFYKKNSVWEICFKLNRDEWRKC